MTEQDIAKLVQELNDTCFRERSQLPMPFSFSSDGCVCWVEMYGTAIWSDDNDSTNISQIRTLFVKAMQEMEENFTRARIFLNDNANFIGKYPEDEE